MHPQHTHIQSNTGKLCLLPPAKSQSMTKLDLTMVSMCSKSPGRAMTTFAIHSSQQPLVCAETTWVSRCFPLAPSVDKAVILTRDIPTTSGTRVASETQTVRWQEQRRDIHGFWDQTGRTLMKMVLSWRADSGSNPSVLELDRMEFVYTSHVQRVSNIAAPLLWTTVLIHRWYALYVYRFVVIMWIKGVYKLPWFVQCCYCIMYSSSHQLWLRASCSLSQSSSFAGAPWGEEGLPCVGLWRRCGWEECSLEACPQSCNTTHWCQTEGKRRVMW